MKSFWTAIGGVLLLLGLSCKEDGMGPNEEIIPIPDVRVSGTVLNYADNNPIPNLELFFAFDITGPVVFQQAVTDENGNYQFEILSLNEAYRQQGVPSGAIFDALSKDEFGMDLFPNLFDCNWIPVNIQDPSSTVQYFHSLPVNVEQHYLLAPATSMDFQVIDTAETRNLNTTYTAQFDFSLLGQAPFFSWERPYLENFDKVIFFSECLPLNEPVELKATFTQLIPPPFNTALNEHIYRDTLIVSDKIIKQYVFLW